MKKQIFILVFLVVATFASVTNSFGQLLPRTVTCLTPDALHPIAGQPFNYIIDVPTPAGTKVYTWFVTQETKFIVAGALTTAIEDKAASSLILTADDQYNNPASVSNTVSITWKSFAYVSTKPVFVVVQVQNTASTSDGCVTKNMKVYKIVPQNSFSLDIANLLESTTTVGEAGLLDAVGTYGANLNKCIHDIVAAEFDVATDSVKYNYGTDYMYYEVVAANFNTSWKPTFTLTGVLPRETVTLEWSTTKAFAAATTHALTLTAGVWSSTDVYTAVVLGGAVGPTPGESIYVRLTLNHSATFSYEGLASEPIALAVDGLTNLSATLPADYIGDVHTVAGATLPAEACPWVDGYTNDIANQTLLPRPTINAGATMPTPGLVPVKILN